MIRSLIETDKIILRYINRIINLDHKWIIVPEKCNSCETTITNSFFNDENKLEISIVIVSHKVCIYVEIPHAKQFFNYDHSDQELFPELDLIGILGNLYAIANKLKEKHQEEYLEKAKEIFGRYLN